MKKKRRVRVQVTAIPKPKSVRLDNLLQLMIDRLEDVTNRVSTIEKYLRTLN